MFGTLTVAPRLFCAVAATLLETTPYRVTSRGHATMATRDDLPPSRSAKPMDPPPASGRPTTAQLKGDIDSGRTGDKVGVFDPALAPLGTDDEAAGAPPSREAIAMARRQERGGPAGGGGNAPQGGCALRLHRLYRRRGARLRRRATAALTGRGIAIRRRRPRLRCSARARD